MTRLESVACTLAGGSVTVFVLSTLLRGQSWVTALLVIAIAVAVWARRAPLVAGMALGVVGWLFLTGFDVNSLGNLRLSGWVDAVRLVTLAGVAPMVALAGRLIGPAERYDVEADMPGPPEDQVWATPHRLMGVSAAGRYGRQAARASHLGPRSRSMRNGPNHPSM